MSEDKNADQLAATRPPIVATQGAITAATSVAAGVGVALAVGAAPVGAIAAAAAYGLSLIVQAYDEHKQRVNADWWERVRSSEDDGGPSDDEFDRMFAERAKDPAVAALVAASLRAAHDQIDPAATVPIARLARWYTIERRPLDRFYRDAGRLVADMTAAELADTRAIMRWLASEEGDEFQIRSGVEFGGDICIVEERGSGKKSINHPAQPLLALLRKYAFGQPVFGTGAFGESGDDGGIRLDRATIESFVRVLGAQ